MTDPETFLGTLFYDGEPENSAEFCAGDQSDCFVRVRVQDYKNLTVHVDGLDEEASIYFLNSSGEVLFSTSGSFDSYTCWFDCEDIYIEIINSNGSLVGTFTVSYTEAEAEMMD